MLTDMVEYKEEKKELGNFLNKGETVVEITRDENSMFRCLAYQTLKNQNDYNKVKINVD